MNYVSTAGKTPGTTFRDAVYAGLAPDGGLFVPEQIPQLPAALFAQALRPTLHSVGTEVLSPYMEDLSREDMAGLLQNAWTFPMPLVRLQENLFLLELFHGPTLAFKDVGARFLARVLSRYQRAAGRDILIAVATSGDTGSAVAHGFFDVPGTVVHVLYPSGRVSPLQERQMTTLGRNIHAFEVEGTFDDCQRLVKQALLDNEVLTARRMTTANSINLGRLLPQVAYYVWAYVQWKRLCGDTESSAMPAVVVPSGNFGNLTAAVYAKAAGTPFGRLVAATNVNDVGARYLQTGAFHPRPAVPTYSSAMDVGNPSNLARIRHHYGDDVSRIRMEIEAVTVNDSETLEQMCRTHRETGRVVDPHTAVGLAAARSLAGKGPTIVVSTAHSAKFPEVVEQALGLKIELPLQLQEALRRSKQSRPLPARYEAYKEVLLRQEE